MDTVHSAITEPSGGCEIFTGGGRRRKWSEEDKARIVAEILASGDSVCAVARRHGLSPQQLFGWRRRLRESAAGHSEAEEQQFVPAVVDVVAQAPAVRGRRKAPRCSAPPSEPANSAFLRLSAMGRIDRASLTSPRSASLR
jgi:transposase